MSSGTETSEFVVYSFSGSRERFQEWKVKMLSLAFIQKVHLYLTQKLTIPSEAEAEAKGDGTAKIKTFKGNTKAFDLLVCSCTSIPLGLIELIDSGNANDKTKKEDILLFEESWTACKLEWLSQALKDQINWMLKSIDSRYKKDGIQVADHFLNNVSKDYANVVTDLEASEKIKDVEAIQDSFEV